MESHLDVTPEGVTLQTMTLRQCTECRKEFHGRSDARTCSTACRQRAYRARAEAARPAISASEQASLLRTLLTATLPGTLANLDPLTKLHMAKILEDGLPNIEAAIEKDRAGWRPTPVESKRVRTACETVLSGGCDATWLIPESR